MGFFDRLPAPEPEPEPPLPPPPAWVKPEAALPGVVADEFILARTDDAAIAITALSAYRTGFGFTLSIVLRREDRGGRTFDHNLLHRLEPPGEPLPPRLLRLGVQFADGAIATNLDGHPAYSDGEPAGPILLPGGGGGGGRRYDMSYWVWPLPPPGPVAFVCEWPAHGIAETRAEIDAQRILDAAARSIQLWPEGDDEAVDADRAPEDSGR